MLEYGFLDKSLVSPILVGRTREIQLLDQALRSAQNGAGRCILLAGEAGTGKSHLVAELRARAVAEQFVILQGHGFEQDLSFPYAPWIDALRAFLAPKSTAETTELLGSLSSELVKLLPELSLLMPQLQPTPPLGPEAEKRRLFESITRFCASLAATHPVLIVLEDLHWSDEQSLELLHFFVRRVSALSILCIGTCRTEELSSQAMHQLAELNRERLVEEIQLEPLLHNQVGLMAQAILNTEHSILPNLLDDLVRLTKGNPFFVEELLKSLPETGTLDRLEIPRSIQDWLIPKLLAAN